MATIKRSTEEVSRIRREASLRRWNGVTRRRTKTIRVTGAAAERLQQVAARANMPQVDLATQLIEEGLDRFEQDLNNC